MTDHPAPTISALIAEGMLDAELAGLLWLLLESDLALVVSGPALAGRDELAEALEQLVAAGGPGKGRAARLLWLLDESSLEGVFGHFSRPPFSLTEDQLRGLGLVLVLGPQQSETRGAARRRLVAAHYLRPVERDAAGHLQRRPPALLAARDRDSDRLEHFAWAISAELADRLGLATAEFEASLRRRSEVLAELVAAGSLAAADLRRAAGGFRPSQPH